MAKGKSSTRGLKGKAAGASKSLDGGSKPSNESHNKNVPSELQQKCLNIFRDALKPGTEVDAIVQEVKGLLYNRDFAAAFGKEEYLRVYASRWSPSRALGYLQVFADVEHLVLRDEAGVAYHGADAKGLEVVCLGGGAGAELVGLAGWASQLQGRIASFSLQVNLVDAASWGSTVRDLHQRSVTPPELSKYASVAAREANTSLLSESTFKAHFHQQDVLQWAETEIGSLVGGAKLVTLMFTLNELYSASIQKTQRLLCQLTASMTPNACLLVVDSPGSYSTVSINGAEKKYPMQWLLDYTLLGSSQKVGSGEVEAKWEKVLSDDSRWFRLPQGLRYPIELENMRYQIHLYRRIGSNGAS